MFLSVFSLVSHSMQLSLPQSIPCHGLDLVSRSSSLSPAFSTIFSLYPVRPPSFSSASLRLFASLLPTVYGTNMTALISGTLTAPALTPALLAFILPVHLIFLVGRLISSSSSSSSLFLFCLYHEVFSNSFFLFLDLSVALPCL